MLDPQAVVDLAARCAPGVAPATLLALAQAESGLNPLAIGVNGPPVRRPSATTSADATAVAKALVGAGRDIDLGLAQINVRNLSRLGLSIEAAFDPCRSLAAGAQVLREGYVRAAAEHGPGQTALRVALSYYNTGSPQRGFANGYVARVLHQAGAPLPPPPAAIAGIARPDPSSPPSWDVFARAARLRVSATFVISPAGAAP